MNKSQAPAATHSAQAAPFLKWAGGKRQLLKQYQPYFPSSFNRYAEPFLGGAACFFHLSDRLAESEVILSDLNPKLIETYSVVQQHVEPLVNLLQVHAEMHEKDYYYAIREQRHLICPVARAARFIYLNRTCFNGLYRENAKGEFNVPIGRYKAPLICDSAGLRQASQALSKVLLVNGSFTQLQQWSWHRDDFVYFDPPYYPTSDNFNRYTRHGFTEADQHSLRDVFATLVRWGVKVMLSNSDCDFIRDLYKEFYIHTVQARRSVNSKASKRGPVTELVITSYTP